MSDDSEYYDEEDEFDFDFIKKRKDSIEEDHSAAKEEHFSQNDDDQENLDSEEGSEEEEFQLNSRKIQEKNTNKALDFSNKSNEAAINPLKLYSQHDNVNQKDAHVQQEISGSRPKTVDDKSRPLGLFSVLDEITKKPNQELTHEERNSSVESSNETEKQDNKKEDYSNDGIYEQHGDLSEDEEDKLLVELGNISNQISKVAEKQLRIESKEAAALKAQKLAKMRLKSPKVNTDLKELGSYLNKVSPKSFQQGYYTKCVKCFANEKERNLEKLREENEEKEKEKCSLKPQLNHDKNKSIKLSHEQRLTNYLTRKRNELEILKKELDEKRRENEMKEATFQPTLIAKKANQKFVKNLAAKANVKTSASQHLLSHLDGSNQKTHLCLTKIDKEENMSFKPKLSKKTLEIGAQVFRSTSPDVIQRFEMLEAQRQEKLLKTASQITASFKPKSSHKSRGVAILQLSPRQIPSSVRGFENEKGINPLQKLTNHEKDNKVKTSQLEKGEKKEMTEEEVQKLLGELIGPKKEDKIEEKSVKSPRTNTIKGKSTKKALEKEENYDLSSNTRNIEQNLEQLQDNFNDDSIKYTQSLMVANSNSGETDANISQKNNRSGSPAKKLHQSNPGHELTPVRTNETSTIPVDSDSITPQKNPEIESNKPETSINQMQNRSSTQKKEPSSKAGSHKNQLNLHKIPHTPFQKSPDRRNLIKP